MNKKTFAIILLVSFALLEILISIIVLFADLEWSTFWILSGVLVIGILIAVLVYIIILKWKKAPQQDKKGISSEQAIEIAINFAKFGRIKEPERLEDALEPNPDEFDTITVKPEHIGNQGVQEPIFSVEGKGKHTNNDIYICMNGLEPSLIQKGFNLTELQKKELKSKLSSHPPIEQKIEDVPFTDEFGQQRVKRVKTSQTPEQKKEAQQKEEEAKTEL